MYDMSRTMAPGMNDSLTKEKRIALLEQISQQRWVDAEIGAPTSGPRILPGSGDAYAADPKELQIIKDANHVDLYDRMDKIPFDRISAFFGKNL
jgi:hypothetical protein